MRDAVEAQVIADRRAAQVRGTQTLVDQMGWMLRHPAVIIAEVGWRWIFGIPFLLVCRERLGHVLAILTPEESGLSNIDPSNPWVAAAQLSRSVAKYRPLVTHELVWVAPIAALAWIAVSGLGRSVVFKLMQSGLRFRPLSMMALQTVWLILFGSICWGWFRSVSWAAATHFPAGSEPD